MGDGDEHMVDHPPIFACREHRQLLRLSERFVAELLALGEDVMPGNPDEIAASYTNRELGDAFRLPEFLIPPKLILFNPHNVRGVEALPFATVLIDKRFFGIPARYLTPDRFDGCEVCGQLQPKPRRRSSGRLRAAPPRRPPPSGPAAPPRRPPPKGGPPRGPRRPPAPQRGRKGPPAGR